VRSRSTFASTVVALKAILHVHVLESRKKPDVDFPTRYTIHYVVNKLRTSVPDKIKRRCHVLTEERHDIGAELELSRRKSLAKVTQQGSTTETTRELFRPC
jgi:hypothetical protein